LTATIYPDATPNDLADNPRTQNVYDELGRVIATIDENGNREEYDYNIAGQLIESRSDCRCRRKTYTYDGIGNKLTETDPLGRTTYYTYDILDRLIDTRYADGTHTSTTYDILGRVASQTNQLGNTTRLEYDERDRNTAIIDALGQRTEYGYDLVGNLISIKDANSHTTSYEYDALNRRTVTIIPLGQRSNTNYDGLGNITSTTDFSGNTISYTYDVMNRLKTKQLGVNNIVRYNYNSAGQISSIVDARGTTSYNYDERDRLTKKTETDGQTIQYTYDLASNRTGIITLTGTTTYTYNRYNEMVAVTNANGGTTNYTYDKAGNLTKIQRADGTIESRTYDALNRLTKQETSNSTGVISGLSYTLDAAGKRVQALENNGRQVDYTYDKLDRLLTETITDGVNGDRTGSYVYDAIGNRTNKTDSLEGTTTYTYDSNDRLLIETNGNKTTTYTYDNNGNTLTRNDGTSQTVNTWDTENRLIQTVTDGNTTQYRYDANGVRVSSNTNGVETKYLIDTNRPHAQVLMEYSVAGTPLVDYTYGLSLLEQQRNGVKSFYHADGLGSIRYLTNGMGIITDSYIYDAYGKLLSSVGQTANNYLYTGEQFDKNLGQYYLRARYYNPSMGRFTARDPFDGLLMEPLSLAKYPYVHGNPVNAIDPSGMFLIGGGFFDALSAQAELAKQHAALTAAVFSTVRSFLFRSLGQTAWTTGTTIGTVALATKVVTLLIAKNTLRNCNALEDKNCRAGIPIVFFGQAYNGGSLRETTAHIQSAIVNNRLTPLVSAYATRPTTHGTPGWYKTRGECGGKGRHAYKDFVFQTEGDEIVNKDIICDEYPFNSTNEGGLSNFERGLVSLKNVRRREGTPQSQLLNEPLLRSAGVIPGDFLSQWYGVVSIQSSQSGWKNAKGKIVNWG
jgi:RHS repeat-associated protein